MSPVAIRGTDTPLDAFNPDVNYVALGLARSGVYGSAALEGHRPLQGRRPHPLGDLDRAAQPGGVDARLRGLLDHRRRRAPPARACGGRPAPRGWPAAPPAPPGSPRPGCSATASSDPRGPYPATGTPLGSPNIASASIQQPIGPAAPPRTPWRRASGCGGRSRRRAGRRTSRCASRPPRPGSAAGPLAEHAVQPDPDDAARGWSRSDGPAVKYISSAPGTRTLTLPCPLAEIAPLATTRWAMSATCPASSLSMTTSPWSRTPDACYQGI